MTREPIVVTADTLAYDALQLMENRPSQISVLPVVDADHNKSNNICLGLLRFMMWSGVACNENPGGDSGAI
jgi:arabinose-5-phosphate isomerase